jgi:hypothetical protein
MSQSFSGGIAMNQTNPGSMSLRTLLFLLLVVGLAGCERKPPGINSTISSESIKLSRSNSEFHYHDRGDLTREYRLFGVTANPFGENNRDDYVSSFGVPLMTTHLLRANHREVNKAIFSRANCEQESAENGFNIVVIAADEAAQRQLDELASAVRQQGGRLCAKLVGKDLEFDDWLLDGKSRGEEVIGKMTLKKSGFNFGTPFFVTDAEKIDCE